MTWRALAACATAAAATLLVSGAGPPAREVVVTGVQRPLQLAVDGTALVILAPARGGDAAAELHHVDLGSPLPVSLAAHAGTRIPFADDRLAALGSLAVDPATHTLFLGEENGSRVYRMRNGELELYATGLQQLAGGGTLAIDTARRLLVLDFVQPGLGPPEEPVVPPGLEQFRHEDYRGPLLFRLALDAGVPLPRRLDRLAPFFPRAWGGRAGGALLPKLVSIAPVGHDVVAVTSAGEMLAISDDGGTTRRARLPRGQYLRINMASAPDGSVYVSGGFWVASLFRVRPDGAVTPLATRLSDPQGVAVDADGRVYLAESSAHRILRFSP